MRDKEEALYANTDLEKKVLSQYIRFDSTIALKVEYFTIWEARQLFQFAQKHHRLADNLDEWWDIWKPQIQRAKGNVEKAHKFLQSLWMEEQESDEKVDYYLEQLRGFAEGRKLRSTYVASIELFDKGMVTEARELLRNDLDEAQKEFGVDVISRSDFIEDFSDRYKSYRRHQRGLDVDKLPTGIAKLDRRITGVPRASLNLIQGESGIGKTFILLELAYRGFVNGFKVLFVTVELRREVIETRWDSRITGIETERIGAGHLDEEEEALWRKRARDLAKMKKKGGRLATAFIPEGCTSLTLESELNYWGEKWGAPVDIFVIDYADLMSSGRKAYSEQETQGAVFRDLKRLCQVHNLVLWTGTQLSGVAYGKRQVGLGDVGYSKKKAHWSNLILGIGADANDKEEGLLPIWVAKNNFGKANFEIILYPDFSKGLIDVDADRRELRKKKVKK